MKAVIAAPFLIPPTHLSFILMDKVKELFSKKYKTEFLPGPLATRPSFNYVLEKDGEIETVIYGGHGTEDMLVGEDIITGMLSKDRLPENLRNKIVVAIPACLSAIDLGPEAIRRGAKAYAGAKDVMYAAYDDEERRYFSDDWVGSHLLLYQTLLDGGTIGEAVKRYQERCRELAEHYRRSRLLNGDWHAMAFEHNAAVTEVLGDSNARLANNPGPSASSFDLRSLLFGFSPLLTSIATAALPPAINWIRGQLK
jgi:hypothetical protein